MIELRKDVVEEPESFVVFDIDSDAISDIKDTDLLEHFFSEGLFCMKAKPWIHEERRGWFMSSRMIGKVRITAQKVAKCGS